MFAEGPEILDPMPDGRPTREHDVRSATARPVGGAKAPEDAVMDALPTGLSDRQRLQLACEILLAIEAAGWRFASKTDDRARVWFRVRPAEGGDQ